MRKLAQRHRTVVAVVGAGHLQGIRWGGKGLSWALPACTCLQLVAILELAYEAAAGCCVQTTVRARARKLTRMTRAAFALRLLCRNKWESEINIEEIMRVPEKRQPWPWGRITLLAGGVLLTSALVRYGVRR